MGGNPVAIGPWRGGLNLRDDPTRIGDDELIECINFNLDYEGKLIQRNGLSTYSGAPWGGSYPRIIGTTIIPSGVKSNYSRVWVQGGASVYYSDTLENAAPIWNNILTKYINAVVPYNNFGWMIPSATGDGYKVDLFTNALTAIPSMPAGERGVIFKDRLFIYGEDNLIGHSRVYYSAATDPGSWPAANFFDVSPGDGENITGITVYNDALVIFKQRSTYILYFDTDPGLGTLREINSEIGCTSFNSFTNYGNLVYIIGERSVYRLINTQLEDIAEKLNIAAVRGAVDFRVIISTDAISVIDDKIICRIDSAYGGNDERTFVYHTGMNAWTEWDFFSEGLRPGKFWRIFTYLDTNRYSRYVASDVDSNILEFMVPDVLIDQDIPETYELFTSSMRTKLFDFGNIFTWKRLFYWVCQTSMRAYPGNYLSFVMRTDKHGLTPGGSVSTTVSNVYNESDAILGFPYEDTLNAVKVSAGGRFKHLGLGVSFTLPSPKDTRITIHSIVANINVKAEVSKNVTVG